MWHTLTNHPAHQQKDGGAPSTEKSEQPKSDKGTDKGTDEKPNKGPDSSSK
jgi:hypothetical protein